MENLSIVNLGSKVEITKPNYKVNTNIKENDDNFKNYLKKEVNNTSEEKNNILNQSNEESDLKANYVEDEVVDVDSYIEISEKIEKFLGGKELNLQDLNLQDLNFEDFSEELKEIISLLLNIVNINFNSLNTLSNSENLINDKSEGFKSESDFIFAKSINLNSLDSNFKVTVDNSEEINIEEINIEEVKDILKDMNAVLIKYLDTNLNKDISNINSNNIVNDANLDNISEELLNDLKKLVDSTPKNILKDITSKLDSNPKKEILSLLISEVENEKKNIVVNKDNVVEIKNSNEIMTDEAIVKTVEKFDENNIKHSFTKDKYSDTKNEKSSKEDDILMKILEKDDNQNFSKTLNYYNKFNKSNLGLDVVKNPVIINKDNINLDFIKSVKYMFKNSIEELNVKIYPKELGEITIKLLSEAGIMKAEIKATSKETYNLLNSNINEIKKTLENQNIRIQEVNIGIYNEDTTFFSNNENSRKFYDSNEISKVESKVNLNDEEVITDILNEGNVNFLA